MIGRALTLALAVVVSLAGSLTGQSAQGTRVSVISGVETRNYRFAAPFAVKSISQVTVPYAAVISSGKLSIDVGGSWAASTLRRREGGFRRVTGLTDTQVRAAYILGQDAIVASVLVNLPTGLDRLSPADFDVLGGVSSAFLAFPVNSYSNGASVTTALAGVIQVGSWNLGLAGSVRASRKFTPIVDPVGGPFEYRAGVEGRLRIGADRLIGQAKLSMGLTVSELADDVFAGGGIPLSSYQPGRRWIGEVSLITAVWGGTVAANSWAYHRREGRSSGLVIDNRESLIGTSLSAAFPVTSAVDLEPGVEMRYSDLDAGDGLLLGGGAGVRVKLNNTTSFWGGGRFETGFLDTRGSIAQDPNRVFQTGLQSLSFSAFIRRNLW